jgi:hypothetical protein
MPETIRTHPTAEARILSAGYAYPGADVEVPPAYVEGGKKEK